MNSKPATIIGGGLAGLTLGIALRREGTRVSVIEAGSYPRHRVCGEFISGRGIGVLERLGLLQELHKAGALPARSIGFYFGSGRLHYAMPIPALSISRYVLDDLLAQTFRNSGGDLRERERWSGTMDVPGVVRATGRKRSTGPDSRGWFGVKAHARGVALNEDLEMHVGRDGYVGISRLPGDEANICGLFRPSTKPGSDRFHLLRGQPGSALHRRLEQAAFETGSLCAVGGLRLKPQSASASTECRIGDAITMIAPLTGNGMSMAFESAEIASKDIALWSSGRIGWEEGRARIGRACDSVFRTRLRWAAFLQFMLMEPVLRGMVPWFMKSDRIFHALFQKTR